MGDRTSVQIIIGGPLLRAMIPDFLAAAECEGLGVDWGNGPDLDSALLEATAKEAAALVLNAHEANYGNVEEMEEFCRKHGLTYAKAWDTGGGYPAGGERVGPEGSCEYPTAGTDGEPMVSASDLRRFGSWEAVTAHLEEICRPVPPLALVGQPAADEVES